MASIDQDFRPSSYKIYTGVWCNWTNGRIFGATLTLNRREGALFIAFLALFVSVVGTHFWRISCFALHHAYSTEEAQDALHHQCQVVLRNSANGTSGLVSLVNILWTWGQKNLARNPFQRTLPLIGFAALCMVAFGAAGTFSSKISTSLGNEVLIHGANCGILDSAAHTNLADQETTFYPYMSQLMNSHASYAEQCFTNTSDAQNCNAYAKQQLPTKVDRNASCPFQEEICKLKHGNIVFDTGYLDSHFDFGINAREHERVLFRRVSSCAPIKSDGYREYDQSGKSTASTRYYYGAGLGKSNNAIVKIPFTYEYPDYTWTATGEREKPFGISQNYVLEVFSASTLNGSYFNPHSVFQPISALKTADADVHLLFLSANWVGYATPVNDAWYSAHWTGRNITLPAADGASGLYEPDDLVSVLACSVKEQYCNPNLPLQNRCSPFGGTHESAALADGLWENARHQNIFRRISSIFLAYALTLKTVPSILGSSSLMARYKLQAGVSGSLPDDQWQVEAEHWHQASLVGTQGIMALTANGPSDDRLDPWLRKPNNDVEEDLCRSQKIKSLEHSNFSLFGLCFTLTLGLIIICLAYALEPLVSWIQARRNLDVYARLEWNTNDTLQLQRLAHEELGVGMWDECASDVPVTQRGERLAVLDLQDLDHPRLKAPPPVFNMVLASGENQSDGISAKEKNTPCPSAAEANSDTSRTTSALGHWRNSDVTRLIPFDEVS